MKFIIIFAILSIIGAVFASPVPDPKNILSSLLPRGGRKRNPFAGFLKGPRNGKGGGRAPIFPSGGLGNRKEKTHIPPLEGITKGLGIGKGKGKGKVPPITAVAVPINSPIAVEAPIKL